MYRQLISIHLKNTLARKTTLKHNMVKHIKFLTNKFEMIKKGLWILLYNFPVKEKKPKITKVLT